MPTPRDYRPWTYNDRQQMVQGYFRVSGRRSPVRRKLASYAELELDAKGQPRDKRARARKARFALLYERYNAARAELDAQAPGDAPTFAAAFATFLADRRGMVARGTTAYYERTLAEYLAAVGDHRLTQAGGPDGRQRRFPADAIPTFRAALQARRLSIASVNIRLQVLRRFLGWCYERDLLDRLPRVEQVPKVKRAPRAPDLQALQAFLARLAKLQRPQITPNARRRRMYHLHERVLVLAMATGLRRAEIYWLPWSQIDVQAGQVTVRVQTRYMVKGRREKTVPLLPFGAAYLKRVRDTFPLERMLLDDGRGGLAIKSPDALTKAFGRHRDLLGAGAWKAVHGFRSWYATAAERAGVPPSQIQSLLGHQQLSTTLGYLADPEGRKRAAVDTFAAGLPALDIGNALETGD